MASYKTCYVCGKIIPFNEECECKKEKQREDKKKRNEYMKQYTEENAEVVKPLKTQRWRKFRRQIIHRDGGHCQRCKVLFNKLTYEDLQVHHIKPRIKYPELIFEETNCITLCGLCNREIGTAEELDFEPVVELDTEIIYIL